MAETDYQIEDHALTSEQAQALLDEARADLAAGAVVAHERVVEWALLRAGGERVALPAPDVEMGTRSARHP